MSWDNARGGDQRQIGDEIKATLTIEKNRDHFYELNWKY